MKQAINIIKILKSLVAFHASDLHLQSGSEPMIRIDEELRPLNIDTLTTSNIQKAIYLLLDEVQKNELETTSSLSFTLELNDIGRFRVKVGYSEEGLIAHFRSIPTDMRRLSDLDLPEVLEKEIIHYKKGLIIVSGEASGSGISTTAAMMLHEINSTQRKKIIIVGSPIEYLHKNVKSQITHFSYTEGNDSFSNLVSNILEYDCDVVYIDRLDSYEKLLGALKLVRHGILVITNMLFATMEEVIEELQHLSDINSREYIMKQLAKNIKAVITQILVPKIGGAKVAVNDIILSHPDISNLIRTNKLSNIAATLSHLEKSTSMQSQSRMLAQYVKSNIISKDNALAYSNNVQELNKWLSLTSTLIS